MAKRKQAFKVPEYTEEEIHEHAARVIRGELYLPQTKEQTEWGFGLILGLLAEQYTKASLGKIGGVAGRMDSVLSQAVNGVPMFTGCLVYTHADWEKLTERVVELEKRLEK